MPHAPPPQPRWKRLLLPDWQSRKRMMRFEAWVVVFASYVLLALAYLWPQDYRNEAAAYVLVAWAGFLVRVLQFHVGLLLLIIAFVAAFVRGKRLLLAAVPVVLFTLGPPLFSHLRPTRSPATASPALRVMSCNLLMVNNDTAPILREVLAADPDVLLLQEYTDEWHKAASAALSAQYPYSSFVTRDDSFGVAIYSRLPFVGEVDNRLPLGRAGVEQTRAVVRASGRDVAVYNVHLLPPRRLDYTIDSRLQFAELLETLAEEKLPYVVGGDFNLTNDTAQHHDLERIGARDAHDLAGRGRGSTWPVNTFFRYLPGLRLDHVYLGPGLTAVRTSTGTGRGSDHRPVITDVAWDATAPATPPRPAPTTAPQAAPAPPPPR
jgi:endonuclease/exonuclease/phosphatase (EEP) superfamily protein YafD